MGPLGLELLHIFDISRHKDFVVSDRIFRARVMRPTVLTAAAVLTAGGALSAGIVYSAARSAGATEAANSTGAAGATATGIKLPHGFSARLFASAPKGATGPDDIARLGGHLFVGYQNGVGSKGEPAPGGNTQGTVVEYSQAGKALASWRLTGKIDGLGADPAHNRIVATVNEDGNSSLYTIQPDRHAHGKVTHYAYGPKPLPHGGGTDSVVSHDGVLFVTASAPAANPDGTTYSQPALYQVRLSGSTAIWKAVFADNAKAKDAVTGKPTTLNLSDPDSSENVPGSVRRFGGDLLLDSQGDKQLVFIDHAKAATVLNLTTQVDDSAFAPKAHTTLYVVDSDTGRIYAISGPFKAGEAFVSVPKDSDSLVKTLGLLDLKTGSISAFGTGFANPKGLLFEE